MAGDAAPSAATGGKRGAGGQAAPPLISIVTVCRNAQATIAATIASVARQDFTDYEYIIVDGASTDSTVQVLRAHDGAIDRWISEPDAGIYDAWNKGLREARGAYIAFLGADDEYLPGALQHYARHVGANPDHDYVSSRVAYGKRIIGQPWRWRRFRRYMNVAHVGSLHSRRLYERVGAYDTSYRIVGDYELLLRAGSGLRAGFVPQVTVRMGVEGASAGSDLRVFAETLRAKVASGAVARPVAAFDAAVAWLKFRVRRATGRLS